MENLFQNKQAFLRKKPKNLFLVSIMFILLLLVVLAISLKVEVYDHYLTRGYVNCRENCKIIVAIPTNIDIQKIKFNKKYIKPNILSKTIEIDKENVISYYLYTFTNIYGLEDKEIVELNFCYNKQRLLKKFINSIF